MLSVLCVAVLAVLPIAAASSANILAARRRRRNEKEARHG
jgi:hypothetical protein